MKIAIPDEFKDNYWNRELCVARKSDDCFLIYNYDVKKNIKDSFEKMSKNKGPNHTAFCNFILANTFETKSVNDLLELPDGFEDFYDCELSFLAEQYRVSVSKV